MSSGEETGTLKRDGQAPSTPLDNPIFHALSGPQRSVALNHGAAWRYESEVSSFAALPDEPDQSSWDDLRSLVSERPLRLIRGRFDVPSDWRMAFSLHALQFVGDRVAGEHFSAAQRLDASHVGAMTELVKLTRPGPFAPRTIELGNYVGVFDGERLVAMAGNRFRLAGFREISAVCTDPEYRGRGLGAALVRHLVALTREGGDQPILHVAEANTSAIALYERLGFSLRREVTVAELAPAGD